MGAEGPLPGRPAAVSGLRGVSDDRTGFSCRPAERGAGVSLLRKLRHHGLVGSARIAVGMCKAGWHGWRVRKAPRYRNPSAEELEQIERELRALGVEIADYSPSVRAFQTFQVQGYFPDDYLGGSDSPVWHEKLLEHWIASERLGLLEYGANEIYVDVAAASSPWAHAMRECKGIDAYAIDLDHVGRSFRHLPYYRIENATATSFADGSVQGASLHCAYEMFLGDDDSQLIREIARILAPGGKVVILPLYLHSHYCAYATATRAPRNTCAWTAWASPRRGNTARRS